MTKLYSKLLCPKMNIFDGDLIEVKNKQVKSHKMEKLECKSCTKMLFSHYSQGSSNRVEFSPPQEEFTSLPQQTLLVHLNEKILYDECAVLDIYKDKTILMIGAGAIKRTSVLETLKRLNFKKKVNLITCKSWTSEYFDDFIYAESDDILKKEDTLQAVKNYMVENNVTFDAIFTYDEFCVLMTAYVTTELGLPGIPYEVACRVRNKYEFRKYCKELGIYYPEFNLVESNERAEHVVKIEELLAQVDVTESMKSSFLLELVKVETPFVMKNTYGLGKDFVRRCYTLEDYVKYLKQSIELSAKMDLLIETFFTGHEIDIDLVVQNNEAVFMAVSDNFAPDPTFFFERGGTSPSFTLSTQDINLVKSIVSKWISDLKINNGCLHFEAICKPGYDWATNGLHGFLMPVEANLRIGGAEAWSMVNTAYGVNLLIEQVNTSLGIPVNRELFSYKENNPRYYCISNDYHPAKNCFIRSIDVNFKEIQADENAVEVCMFRASGDTLRIQDYMGWCTVKLSINSSYDDLLKEREKIMSYIRINLDILN